MKKLLLSMAVAMMGTFAISAQTTVKGSDVDVKAPKTIDGFTIEVVNNNGTTAPAINKENLRLYSQNSLTISGKKLTQVVITLASDAGYRYTTFTPSVGTISEQHAFTLEDKTLTGGDEAITWTGDAASVTFTVGDLATLGTDLNKNGDAPAAGQIRIASITITGEGGETPDTPNPTPDPEPTPDPTPSVDGYVVFDIAAPGTWNGNADAWTNDVTVDGKAFSFNYVKAGSSTDLISPVANTYAWRVYKNAEFTLESKDVDMKTVVITYDDYLEGQYCLEMTLSAGWTGALDGATYTLTGNGKTLTCTSVNGQTRIKKIVVQSDDASIKNIEAAEEGAMVIYNLRGQRLSAPVKGLNIINGKKVLVK